MSERLLLITVPADRAEAVYEACEGFEPMDLHLHAAPDDADRRVIQTTVKASRRQDALDALQEALEGAENWRINVLALEATLPDPREEDPEAEEDAAQETREELYKSVSQQARTDLRYAVFVVLSTVVAAFGMLLDNVAVVIGAMAIAPLLGPNLAFALGASLGDRALMLSALRSGATGLALAALVGAGIGLALEPFFPSAADMLTSPELLSRARPGFDGMVIALAAGAAATLSISSGAAAALVGVMVSVALLPPAVAVGILAGSGDLKAAGGALTLLAINVACVNLSAQMTLAVVGIRARKWYEEERARAAWRVSAAVWVVTLAALGSLLLWTGPFSPPGT